MPLALNILREFKQCSPGHRDYGGSSVAQLIDNLLSTSLKGRMRWFWSHNSRSTQWKSRGGHPLPVFVSLQYSFVNPYPNASDSPGTILYVPLPFLPWFKTGLKNEHARKVLKHSTLIFLCEWKRGVTVVWAEGPENQMMANSVLICSWCCQPAGSQHQNGWAVLLETIILCFLWEAFSQPWVFLIIILLSHSHRCPAGVCCSSQLFSSLRFIHSGEV